jgi:carbon-monoxide dehydrogenase medium subunit
VIPAPFAFVRATSVDEAVAALTEHGDEAKLIAGGHSLLPLMKLRLATPAVLIDVNEVPGHEGTRLDGDDVVVGGLTRHCDLATSPVLREHLPLLRAAAEAVGDPQVRHRGTLAGSLAHGDPASDLPAAVLALGGRITVQGPEGVRTIGADDFFLGFLETALAPDEMITEFRFPRCTGAGWAFEKFNKRAQDWAIVGVAAVGGDRPGVALVNMAATPVRAASVEAALRDGAAPADAAALADAESDPSADLNASAEFRRHLARVLVQRALTTIAAGDVAHTNGSAGVP